MDDEERLEERLNDDFETILAQNRALRKELSKFVDEDRIRSILNEQSTIAHTHLHPEDPIDSSDNICSEISTASPLVRSLALRSLFAKLKGGEPAPKRASVRDMCGTFFGCMVGWLAISTLDTYVTSPYGLPLAAAPFGASAVLLYAVPESPLGQPRHLMFGLVISALVGCLYRQAWGLYKGLDAVLPALAVSTAILAMQITNTVHPPGGAAAFSALALNSSSGRGFLYIIFPILIGGLIMVITAVVTNNITGRKYPRYWWGYKWKISLPHRKSSPPTELSDHSRTSV
mmetsp:Transcript_43332/g.70320  ORF Transcript_43332/g.70320 Transcript_43332/m.70320 type:complete len:288 (+) Transcript_43332:114-977(+)